MNQTNTEEKKVMTIMFTGGKIVALGNKTEIESLKKTMLSLPRFLFINLKEHLPAADEIWFQPSKVIYFVIQDQKQISLPKTGLFLPTDVHPQKN